MEKPSLRNSRASFYDLNARIAYDINRNNKVDFSAYYSYDSFRLNSDTTFQYQNNIAMASLFQQPLYISLYNQQQFL
jgi:hypothetical protein